MTFPPRAMSVIAREAGAVLALTSANRQRLSRDPPEARIPHLNRLGRSLPHLLSIVTGLRARAVASRSLTEQMDATTPHGELLFSIFGALAQYERALTQERVKAGLAAAKRWSRRGGQPPVAPYDTKRTTLIETLARAG